jgi:hypothetical protein
MTAREPSPRPLTPDQLRENVAFLLELSRTGNAREAARRLGAHRAKFTKRRAKHPRFAAQWEAALELAQDRLAHDSPFDPELTHLADGRLQLRKRQDSGINADRKLGFLHMLLASGSVRLAAEVEGFSHAAFYHHRLRDPEFARAWDEVMLTGRMNWEKMKMGVD